MALSRWVLARDGTNSTHQAGEAAFQPNQQRCFLPGWLTTHHRGNPEYIRYLGEQPTEPRRFNLHSVSSPVFSASTALIDRVICGERQNSHVTSLPSPFRERKGLVVCLYWHYLSPLSLPVSAFVRRLYGGFMLFLVNNIDHTVVGSQGSRAQNRFICFCEVSNSSLMLLYQWCC